MAVQDLAGIGIGTAVAALIVNEVVNAMEYTGTGETLLDLLPFFVIAIGVLAMVQSADM